MGIKQLWNDLQEWWKPQAQAVTADTISQPSQAAIQAALANVEAASASIINAYKKWATTFAVVHEGETFLITSAHLTNNRVLASTGFDYRGKKLFPVVHGNKLALAEHIAVNPQGSVCAFSGNIDIEKPFREASILRLLTPEETRTALYDLSFGDDSQTRLNSVLALYSSLGKTQLDRPPSKDTLVRLTKGFALPPLVLSPVSATIGTAQTYSVGYFNNQPHRSGSLASDMEKNPQAFQAKFTCEQPIVGGHSGSLLFSVTPQGGINPVGIVNATDGRQLTAYGTKFVEISVGLTTALTGKAIRQSAKLDAICATMPGVSAWYAPDAIEASATTPPSGTPAQVVPVIPTCQKR